jgi:nucleotidyltransferase/DNA polymerase involved in DNA repair
MKIIFCVDLDAFFASVEESLNPGLKGKPLIIGSSPLEGRGVVSTCNYEARKYGIKSGMSIVKAYRLCPFAVFLPPRLEIYEVVSERIMSFLRSLTSKFEQLSVDEAFLDVTEKVRDWEEAKEFANEIKEFIFKNYGITSSIGISFNKLLAKLACQKCKPNGIKVVDPPNAKEFLKDLRVEELPGIGKQTTKELKRVGIKKVEDIWKFGLKELQRLFGNFGSELYILSQGEGEDDVYERDELKSLGKEITLSEDTLDRITLFSILQILARDVTEYAKHQNLLFKTITLKIKTKNFKVYTRSKTLKTFSDSSQDIFSTCKKLLEEFLKREIPIRLLGIRVSKFCKNSTLKKFWNKKHF